MKNFYPNCCKQLAKHISCLLLVFALVSLYGLSAQAQISGTTSASRCGSGQVTLTATATSGTIKWYAEPFYGAALGTGTSFLTPSLGVTTTYFVDALDGQNCSLNPNGLRVPVTATISANSMQPVIYYASSTFCKSGSGEQTITISGNSGGTFTYTKSGNATVYSAGAAGPLTIDTDGKIIPSSSTVGTYTVTYTAPSVTGCTQLPASTVVSIADAPTTPVIAYSNTNLCSSNSPVSPSTFTGGTASGSFSATPSGLSINASTGEITPSASQTGEYTIVYSVPGGGGCAPAASDPPVTVTILQLPTASINYSASSFTQNQGSQPVTLTGTGVYTGGTFSATNGLTIDPVSGAITPSSSTAGTHTVTYTLAAVSPCGAPTPATAQVTIYGLPTAAISGSTNVCANSTPAPEITFTGSGGNEPYTFTYNIGTGPDLTVTTSTGNSVKVTQATSVPGTYTYNLKSVTDANGSTNSVSNQSATINVNVPKVALFAYTGSPYCSDGTNPTPIFIDGGEAGTFTCTNTDLKFVNTTTGEINLATSTPGTYTVRNTIPTIGGCSEIYAESSITITKLPVADFSYPNSPYCPSAIKATPTVTDAGVFTADDLAVVFVEGGQPGEIDVVLTPAGTYTITNTVLSANGCAQVSKTASVTIQAPPTMTTPRDFTICNNTSPNISLTSNPSGATFTWTIGTITGGITGASPQATSELTAINQVLTNPSNSVVGSVQYIVTPTGTGGGACAVGDPFTITVTVNPTPALSSTLAPEAICSGGTFSYTPTSDAASPTFSWTRATIEGITEEGTSGNGSISETLTNTTAAPINVTYAYTTTSAGCNSATQNVVVTVYPDPTLSQPADVSICKGGTTTLTTEANGGTGTYSYQWQYSANETTGWANIQNGTPANISYTANNNILTITGNGSENPQANYYKCVLTTLTPTGAGCNAETSAITVTTFPDPSWNEITNPATSITYGGSVTFSATVNNGLNGTVSWIRSNNATQGEGTEVTVITGDIPPSAGTWYYRPHYTPAIGQGCDLTDGTQTTVTVSPKALTMSGLTVPNSKVYDGTTVAVVSGIAALQTSVAKGAGTTSDGKPYTGDDVSITGTATGTYNSADVASATTVTYGGLSLTGAQSGNYTLTIQSPASATITAKALTMSGLTVPNSKEYDGTTVAAVSGTAVLQTSVAKGAGTTSDGKPYTDDVVSITGTATGTYNSADVTSATTVTYGGLSLTGAQAGNYTLTIQSPASATITAKPITVATTVNDKVYNGLSATGTVTTGAISGEVVAGHVTIASATSTNYADANVGESKATTISYTLNNGTGLATNYSIANLSKTGNITPAPLTITAGDQSVTYGTAAATVTGAGTYTPEGFVNGENASVISGTVTYTTTYTATTNAGTAGVTITPVVTGLSATNYSFIPVAGRVTITKAESTITVTGSATYTYDNGNGLGPDTSSKTGSTGAVTYSYSGTGSTTYGPSATKPSAVGTYKVTATVAEDTNFNAKTSAEFPFTIYPPAPTGDPSQTFCGN